MRLNKYLAQAGVTSRRKADELIAAGRVRLNGEPITSLGVVVGADDLVAVDGRPVEPQEKKVVYLLHKPAGVISAAADSRSRPIVVDLIRDSRRLFPVGRLDRDTTGALLITNDGALTNRLTHPRYGVEKNYLAEVRGQLPQGAVSDLRRGLVIAGRVKVRANVATVRRQGKRTVYRLTLTEGKNREVKRIFRHYDLPVLRLHRTHFAGLSVDNLPPGRYRRLRRGQIEALCPWADPDILRQAS